MKLKFCTPAVALLSALAVTAWAVPALALEGAPLDGGAHPSVGHIFAQQSDPATCNGQVIGSCSAVLISPTVAVTSGACAYGFANATEYGYNLTATWMTFNGSNALDCASAVRVSSIHVHPLFDEDRPGTIHDIGVIVLSAPATATPATLPAAGSQDTRARGDLLDSVGYAIDDGGNYSSSKRRIAPVASRSVSEGYITTHVSGSFCASGFNGGGIFEPGSQDLVGLDNGIRGCKNGKFLRLDTATSREFLDDFVALP